MDTLSDGVEETSIGVLESLERTRGTTLACGKAWYKHMTYIIIDFLSGVVVFTSTSNPDTI